MRGLIDHSFDDNLLVYVLMGAAHHQIIKHSDLNFLKMFDVSNMVNLYFDMTFKSALVKITTWSACFP